MAATVIEDMRARLMADDAFMALATGKVYVDFGTTNGAPIGPKRTADAYEKKDGQDVLKPCALVSCVDVAPSEADGGGTDDGNGKEEVVLLGLYQALGFDKTRAMAKRARAVFDPEDRGEQFGPLDDGRYYIVRFQAMRFTGEHDDSIQSGDSSPLGVSYEAAQFRAYTDW